MTPPLRAPAPFGQWLIAGDRLVCRQPSREVVVRAPGRLLTQLARACDGTRRWHEVVDTLAERWPRRQLTAFLLRLAHERVLVEAAELWAHWAALAQGPQSPASVASDEEIAGLPLKARSRLLPAEGEWLPAVRNAANPIAATLQQRESHRTFADTPICREALYSILWSAHGVTRAARLPQLKWHRTCGSGGNMHSARWFVAVLRELPAQRAGAGALTPGVYEARFHIGGGTSLERLPGQAQQAWRCLGDARVLRYASALVLPVYDISIPARKYGNRATLFALIEAGQSLQNAQLMATSLGVAGMLRGDTLPDAVLQLAGLREADGARWLAVPGMVLGSWPSDAQRAAQDADSLMRVREQLQPPGSTGFAFAAAPSGSGSANGGEAAAGSRAPDVSTSPPLAGSGRSDEPALAMTKAEAEAWERMAWATPSRVFEARAADLPDAVDPTLLVAYSPRQYARSSFPFKAFSARRSSLWCEAQDCDSGRSRAVLADGVFALEALPQKHRRQAYTNASTSGIAAGRNLDDALMRATLELIERDAVVCAWLAGTGQSMVDPVSLPRPAQRRIEALQAQGLQVTVLDLRSPWCIVLAVFAQSHDLPFTALTAAAGFHREEVLAKALDEAEGRFSHASALPVRHDGQDAMREIERYYRARRTYSRSDFLAQGATKIRFRSVGSASAHDWPALRSSLRAQGLQLHAVDITPPHATVEQGRTPLHVVRAFVPGLLPIWFHRGLQPEGMPRFQQFAAINGARPRDHFIHPFT